jgi:outer membrane protein assembly factor BamD (BamD/ComL family)
MTRKLKARMAAEVCCRVVLLALTAQAQDRGEPPAAPSPALLQEGYRALATGLPQAAAYKLRAFLQTDPPSAERREAVLALARSLTALNKPSEALALLETEKIDPSDGEARFWRGQAQAALGHWREAVEDYQAASAEARVEAEARFGLAEALLALGRVGEAAGVFEKLPLDSRFGAQARLRRAAIAMEDNRLAEAAALLVKPGGAKRDTPHEGKERSYLLGRLRLLQGQPVQSEQIFTDTLAQPEGLSERLLVNLHQALAEACLAQGQTAKAEDVLENFLDRYPRHPHLLEMLAWLDRLYATDPTPDDLTDLRRWSTDGDEPARQALATLVLSRGEARAGRPDRAEVILSGFSEAFPEHPLRSRAWLELAALRLQEGRAAEARQALDQARPLAADQARPLAAAKNDQALGNEIDALDARISLAEGDNADAAKKFEALAARADQGPQAEAAAFNAVLGWRRAADAARSEAAERQFEARFPDSRLKTEFSLEEGLAEAARSSIDDPTSRQRAAACLRRFLRDSPTHPRAPEARIALAELAFMRPRPNLAKAWRELSEPELLRIQNPAAGQPAAGAEADRADYLAIWLADAPGPTRDEDKAISLARKFLERQPDSPLAPEARMKLCEIYFRRDDYLDAQTQLELLVEKTPSSPLAEQALYLAGLAAARSMSPSGLDKAVALFEAAARRNGPFKLFARLRQAELQTRLDKGRDALILYEGVLTATPETTNLTDTALEARCAALGGKGQTLLDLADADPKLYADAARTFEQLAKTPGASLPWRRQALTKRGRALEKVGDIDAALAAYHDALNAEPSSNETPEPEWTWFYRAGSEAARLLEAKADWAAAVAIYRKLAAPDGPLKNEFESLLSRRQLEHFIWTE